MRGWSVSNGIKPAGCVREGTGGFCRGVFSAGHVVGRGSLSFALSLGGPGGAGRLGIGGEVLRSEVGVLGGGGENRRVIFPCVELSCLSGVGEGPSVEFRIAEHFLECGVIKGAVHRRVEGTMVS